MLLIGITGSIGMGKTTVAGQFKACGIPCFDADKAVHNILAHDKKIKEKIGELFPAAISNSKIDRKKLGEIVFDSPEKIVMLEKILHPKVRELEKSFLKNLVRAHVRIAAVDIPLLFETKAGNRFDVVVTVSAPRFLQKQRVLKRHKMSAEKLKSILLRQTPDSEKRKRSDFVIKTGLGKFHSLRQVCEIIRIIKDKKVVRHAQRNHARYRNHRP